MKLFEVLNSALPWEFTERSHGKYEAEFHTDTHRYSVDFAENTHPEFDDTHGEPQTSDLVTELSFTAVKHGTTAHTHGITGDGGALQVFSTVREIVKAWAKESNADSIMFSASEPSRIKLYKRFIPLLQKSGFHLEHSGSDHAGTQTWVFYR